jgi:tripartite ATP-independent transporter DctP family solute receptor
MPTRFLKALLLLAAGGLLLPTDVLAQDKIRMTSSFATGQSSSISMREVFKPQLETLTGGKLTVDLFPDSQLGGAREGVDGVRSGTVFATWVSTSFLTRIVPEMEALSLPFLFPDRAAAFRMIDGPVGESLSKRMRERGFEVLGWMELGERHLTNSKREVRTVDDLKGLKIRLQPNETHLATFRALGANPVTMDVKELYSALQQGVVDGQENPYTVISSNRYPEVQKHLSQTGHFFEYVIIIANKSQYDAMSAANREALHKALVAAVAHQRANAAATSDAALADLKAKGMQVVALSPEVKDEMRKRTAAVVDEVKKRANATFVQEVLDAVGNK